MTVEEWADVFAERIQGWELSSLQHIGERVNKYGKMSISDLKAINNAAVAKRDLDLIMQELADVTALNIGDLQQMYADVLAEQHLTKQPLYDYRGIKFAPIAESREARAVIQAYAKATAGTFVNVSKTKALTLMIDGKPQAAEKAMIKLLDKAAVAVTSGTTDFNTAMREMLKELGGGGVRVNYGSGITRRLDTVIRQSMLYNVKQAHEEYESILGEELGCDGIEIDWHSNPRPSHAFMQGKQYAKGKSVWIKGEYYEGADEAKSPESGETVNQCLDDYGCLHYTAEIILGVSEPRFDAKELKRLNDENEKEIEIDGVSKIGYDWKQDMRKLETAARQTKGEIQTLKASGDIEGAKQQRERLRAIQARYKTIAEGSGIKAQPNRMSLTKGK